DRDIAHDALHDALPNEVLGEKHAYTADSYNNIGCIYSSLGESEKALKYHEKALEIRREVLGEKHADTASSYDNLGIGNEELGGRSEEHTSELQSRFDRV